MNKKDFIYIYATLASSILFFIGFYFIHGSVKANLLKKDFAGNENAVEAVPYVPVMKYGINIDSLNITQDKIKKNESFSAILQKYNLSNATIHEVVQKTAKVYDLRNLQAGKSYTVYHTRDSLSMAKCLVYEANIFDNIVFRFDSLHVYKDSKKADTVERKISGVISSSLYETLINKNAPAAIAVELADIFQTRVDFFRIQKGDAFKVIYHELNLDGVPVGVSRVLAATFEHAGKTHYAVNFGKKGKSDYFDEEGNNIRKGGFLKAPLKFFRITSKYSQRRFHPVQGVFKAHLGTDYAAPTGTPIIAVGDGVITEAKFTQFNGNYVKIKHDNTYSTQYLHMSKIAAGMRPGTRVKQGEVIGYVGSTGLATGPHVCFRFWQNGKQVDATKVKVTIKDPIKKEDLPGYNILKAEMLEALSKISIDRDPGEEVKFVGTEMLRQFLK